MTSVDTTLAALLVAPLPALLAGTSLHTPPAAYATEGALDLYLRAAVHRCSQRPPKGSGTNNAVEATQRPSTAPKHARKHEARPPDTKTKTSYVSIQTILVLFALA